jgi:hypothetical protein
VVEQIRTAGGTRALSAALEDWQQRLTVRGVAMLKAADKLAGYLAVLDVAPSSLGPRPVTRAES